MPSTFVLDSIGVLAPSEPTRDPGWSRMMRAPALPDEVRRGRLIASAISGDRRENWKQNPADSAGRIRLGANAIAYFPSNDMGHEFDPPAAQRSCGMPFGDSESALAALLAALATVAPQTRVVIKRHPHHPLARRFEGFVSERVTIDDAMSVHDAIEAGMVIATTSGSIGWISIAGGANALSLTTRSYTGSGLSSSPPRGVNSKQRSATACAGRSLRTIRGGSRRLARCASRYAYSDDPNYLAGACRARAISRYACSATPIGDAGRCDAGAWLDTRARASRPATTRGATRHPATCSARSRTNGSPWKSWLGSTRRAGGRARLRAERQSALRRCATRVVVRRVRRQIRRAAASCWKPPGVRAEARMESLDPCAQWVVTPLEDGAMIARIPGGVTPVRWRETLESLTRSGSRSAARDHATLRPQTTQPVHREVQHEST